MSISRKDFEAIAETLGQAVSFEAMASAPAEAARTTAAAFAIALAVADRLQALSPRFDRDRFIAAVRACAVADAAARGGGDSVRDTLRAAGVA